MDAFLEKRGSWIPPALNQAVKPLVYAKILSGGVVNNVLRGQMGFPLKRI
jgi:hypothetical protein